MHAYEGLNHNIQPHWWTSDGSPWWLRSTTWMFSTPYFHWNPHGDYEANCYLDVWDWPPDEFWMPGGINYNGGCSYHSKSYYCQPIDVSLKPKEGSPQGCRCTKIELTGKYSAEALLKCKSCLDVSK